MWENGRTSILPHESGILMGKLHDNSLINKALIYLQETSVGLLDLSVTIIFDHKKLMRGMGMYRDYNRDPFFSQKIGNLKRSSYFKEENHNIYLTGKGRTEIIKNIIKGMRKTET